MRKNKTYHRKKTVLLWVLCMGMMVGLAGRLVYLCVFRSVYYSEKADDLHERERGIKAARGRILDANGGSSRGKPHGLYDFRDPQPD